MASVEKKERKEFRQEKRNNNKKKSSVFLTSSSFFFVLLLLLLFFLGRDRCTAVIVIARVVYFARLTSGDFVQEVQYELKENKTKMVKSKGCRLGR